MGRKLGTFDSDYFFDAIQVSQPPKPHHIGKIMNLESI